MADSTPETPKPEATPTPEPEGDWQVPEDLQGEPPPEPEPEAPAEPEIPPQAVWGNPMQMAADIVRGLPRQDVPPPPVQAPQAPAGEIEFDIELAQTDLPRAMKEYTQAIKASIQADLARRDQVTKAQQTAAMVQRNFSQGEQLFMEVANNNPAMKDPAIAKVVSELVREVQMSAIYNPEGSQAFSKRAFFRALIEEAKDIVASNRGQKGYQGPPVAVNMAGARVMSPKQGAGQPTNGSEALTSWEREFCYKHGISEKEYAKNKAATEKEKLASEPWRR